MSGVVKAFALFAILTGCSSTPSVGTLAPEAPKTRDRARWSHESGRLEEALDLCRAAFREDESDAIVAAREIEILRALSREDEADAIVEKARSRGVLLEASGDRRGAALLVLVGAGTASPTEKEVLFRRALRLDPESAAAALFLGNLISERGDTLAAFEHLKAAAEKRPDWSEPQKAYANILVGLGRTAEAIFPLAAYVRRNPSDARAAYNLGYLLLEEHRDGAEAYECLEKAHAAFPEDARVTTAFASAAVHVGKLDLARDLFEGLVARDHNAPDPHYNLGVFYAEHQKDKDRAIREFELYLDKGGADKIRVRDWIRELKGETSPVEKAESRDE